MYRVSFLFANYNEIGVYDVSINVMANDTQEAYKAALAFVDSLGITIPVRRFSVEKA